MKVKKQILIAPLMIALSACSGGPDIGNKIPSTDNVLVVDLHTFMPTGSSSSADVVSITETQAIADEFFQQTGIRIKWYTGKTLDGEAKEASEDYIKSIQNGTMPAIGFSWSAFKDRGYYMDLSEYLNTPNEFLTPEEQQLYPTWKSQFPSYLWKTKECSMADGTIIGLPVYLNPGPATGWFYNKKIFEDNSYDIPTTWNQFRSLAMDCSSDTSGPFPYKTTAKIDNWEFLFSIGPAFAQLFKDVLDVNKDGKIDENETLDGVLRKVYSPLQSENPDYFEYAQAAYTILKDFYTSMLPSNWRTASSETCWSNGTAVLRQNGLWSIRAENAANAKRDWKYGVFAAPVVSDDSANFLKTKGLLKAAGALQKISTVQVEKKEYTISELSKTFIEAYKPTASCYLNLMKHGIYDNKKVLDNAIKFLKFLSTPENVSRVCNDHQGILGGVHNATPGVLLKDWLQQEFPVVPNSYWPDGYTVGNNSNINKALQSWIAGQMSDSEFFTTVSREQIAGATSYKESINS